MAVFTKIVLLQIHVHLTLFCKLEENINKLPWLNKAGASLAAVTGFDSSIQVQSSSANFITWIFAYDLRARRNADTNSQRKVVRNQSKNFSNRFFASGYEHWRMRLRLGTRLDKTATSKGWCTSSKKENKNPTKERRSVT